MGIKHGQGDNGKWVCGLRTLLKRSPCIVYSFGSNGETSFEQDILRATKCARLPARRECPELWQLVFSQQMSLDIRTGKLHPWLCVCAVPLARELLPSG